MPDYKTENLPTFYQVFTTNNDPDTMRDHEVEFLYKYRYGESNLTVAEKKAKLYEENPEWIYFNDNEERDYILAARYREYAPAMAWWFHLARDEAVAEGIDVKNHPLYLPPKDGGPLKADYGILPKSFWNTCKEEIGFDKKYDYSFVGAWKIDQPSEEVRKWVYDFARDNFTDSCYLQFTDKKTKADYVPLGSFDHTLTATWGKVQKELSELTDMDLLRTFDRNFYTVMCQSKFVFCPAGDAPWSMRMYEALMCKAIPIVMEDKETFRTWEESKLGYKYYYPEDEHVYREDWVEHNYNLFMKYHTFHGN